MTDQISLRLSIAAAALISLSGAAFSSTFSIDQSSLYHHEEIGGGELNSGGWSRSAVAGNLGGGSVQLESQPGLSTGGFGFVPGLNAQVLVTVPSKWRFGDTYISGEPVVSVVGAQSIKASFRGNYRVSTFGEVAPNSRYIRLSFFRPERWSDAFDSANNSVLRDNARSVSVNDIPLPGGGPLLAGALLCVLAARRRMSRPS